MGFASTAATVLAPLSATVVLNWGLQQKHVVPECPEVVTPSPLKPTVCETCPDGEYSVYWSILGVFVFVFFSTRQYTGSGERCLVARRDSFLNVGRRDPHTSTGAGSSWNTRLNGVVTMKE